MKKETVTGVRFSKVEYFLVKQKASKAGLGITVYIRQMALHGQVTSKMSEEDRQVCQAVCRCIKQPKPAYKKGSPGRITNRSNAV